MKKVISILLLCSFLMTAVIAGVSCGNSGNDGNSQNQNQPNDAGSPGDSGEGE